MEDQNTSLVVVDVEFAEGDTTAQNPLGMATEPGRVKDEDGGGTVELTLSTGVNVPWLAKSALEYTESPGDRVIVRGKVRGGCEDDEVRADDESVREVSGDERTERRFGGSELADVYVSGRRRVAAFPVEGFNNVANTWRGRRTSERG
jgi:hypothetical protein